MIISSTTIYYETNFEPGQWEIVTRIKARGALPNDKQVAAAIEAGAMALARDMDAEKPGKRGTCWIGMRRLDHGVER